MFLIVKFFKSSKFKILSIFFSISVLNTFGCIMSIEDLTFRLPRDVKPISYVLQLYPDFDTNIFIGEVIIAVEITCQCRFIVMHAKNLTIDNTRISAIRQVDNKKIVTGDLLLNQISIIEEYDMILLETRRIILPGMYEIQMKFNGTMSNDNRGIFMTSYIDPDTGLTRKIASTHFQPTNARRAFPCFDEPGFKAIFNIRLIQPNIDGYHSLSNTPSEISMSGAPLPGLTTVYFKPTLPIQTYLVTFVISDLRNRTAYIPNVWDNSRKILIRAWTTEDNIIKTDLVLHITYQSIEFYNHMFGLDYPLTKIDMVAVPRFFRHSNEKWGLTIFDEKSMLFFDRANSVTDLKIIANKITNRIVRVWFENLVTMEWWSDYWLIESFATYMQYYTNNYIFPAWKETKNFVIDAKYPAMIKDAMISTQPILQLFESPEKLPYLFNDISIKKGASIIRMLHHMMGDINFFRGVAFYLQLYQNRTTITDDFVNCLQLYYPRDENLVRFVRTWIEQSGFPVLNVVRTGNTYYINQTIYSISNVTRMPDNSRYSYKWDLPIFYITNLSNWPKRIFMSYKTEEVQLIVDEQIRWVKFNSDSIGYYIVNYDRKSWNTLSMVLRTQPEKFGVLDRTDLLNDAFINADIGSVPYHLPLGMLSYMKFETEYTPWKMVCDKLLIIHAMLRETGALRKFEVFIRMFIKPIYQLIGWDIHHMDSFEIRRLRMIILKTACVVRMEECIYEVSERFRNWIKNPNTRPHPDIKDIVYYHDRINVSTDVA